MAIRKLNSLPPSLVHEDGTEVRLVPLEKTGGKALYVSADGRCFSFYRHVLRLIKPQATNSIINRHNGRRKQKYLRVRSYGNILVHHAVALVWVAVSDRDENAVRLEVDHLNGIVTDNRVENLQWVTPEDNHKRSVILRARRMIAQQDGRPELLPENMTSEELLELFSKYNVAGDVYEGD